MREGDLLVVGKSGRRGGMGFFSDSQEGNLHGRTATLPRLDVNPIEPPTHPRVSPIDLQ